MLWLIELTIDAIIDYIAFCVLSQAKTQKIGILP